MKKISINLIFLFILNTLSNNIFAQFDILPPPPPMVITPQKKLTPDEYLQYIRKERITLAKNKIDGVKINWKDADLWTIERNKILDDINGERVTTIYLAGLGKEFNIDSLEGILTINVQKSQELALLIDPMMIVKAGMNSLYPGNKTTVIEEFTSEKLKKVIFKVDNVNKDKSLIGFVIFNAKVLALFIFETYHNEIEKEIELSWISRFKKIDLE